MVVVVNVCEPDMIDDIGSGMPPNVTVIDVIGSEEPDGTYKGMKCLLASQVECMVTPRILVAPGFTGDAWHKAPNNVISAFLEIAERLRATVVADCPMDGNREQAIDHAKYSPSDRLMCIYPGCKVQRGDKIVEEPLSGRIAGLIAKSDNERGFWWSPSNQQIKGIVGISKPIDFALGDTNCTANFLNENKVATVIQEDGFRLWGNRTTSSNEKWTFLSVRRTADMINDSLMRAHMWAIDRNITKTYIEDVTGGVNTYLRHLKNIGAIIGGECWADSSLNTPEQIQMGKIIFDFDFTPPYPAEHITFRSRLVNNYLTEIFE
ncbi:phage tail sheath subtilisin-like domain-containing protein [Lachnospiraceae bacterium OttesenSCG-928-E19]|nr:phage tail sheath subtilisin-like domain-containing protein [Lachnospiraceae bacterium OttesenSCG-928-E19]